MRRLLPFLLAPTLAACAVVGTNGVLISPLPGPTPSFRDVFADTRSPSPTAVPSASTAPVRRIRTGRGLDVALNGPGYFVLSSRPDPRDWAELTLTRAGEFVVEPLNTGSPMPGAGGLPVVGADGMGDWTLRTPDGRYVLGWDLQADPDRLAPPEARGTNLPEALALGGPQAQTRVGPLRLPALAGFAPDARLDVRGRLTIGGQGPVDADGRAHWLHVAVAMVDDPSKLIAQGRGFRYDRAAGVVEAGIAGMPAVRGEGRRPVGDANVLEPGYLDEPGGI